jgi:hypothetical protein
MEVEIVGEGNGEYPKGITFARPHENNARSEGTFDFVFFFLFFFIIFFN